jgi:hypothetical protein
MRTIIAILALFALASLVESAQFPSFKDSPWAYDVTCPVQYTSNKYVKKGNGVVCCHMVRVGFHSWRKYCDKPKKIAPKTCLQKPGYTMDISKGVFKCCKPYSNGNRKGIDCWRQ